MADDEIERLRFLLQHAHPQPDVNKVKKVVELIANKLAIGKFRMQQFGEKQRTNKPAA